MTEKEFNNSLMAAVQLSLATSKIAADKLQNGSIKEFAGFELAKAIAISSVLKDLGTLILEMDDESIAVFNEVDTTDPGPAFDQLYIDTQLKNHKLVRDLTEDYLKEAPTDALDKEESQSKYIATLVLTMFNEHIAVIEKLGKELTGV